MKELVLISVATFFSTISPFEIAIILPTLSPNISKKEAISVALRATLIAGTIILIFGIFGTGILSIFGITLPALKAAGGILLFLIALDMVFARHTGATTTTAAETREARSKEDISVFPLATPLIAGPGTISATILLISDNQHLEYSQVIVLCSAGLVLLGTFTGMVLAKQVQQYIGITVMQVIARIMGILLAALAIQFLFEGLSQSGIFTNAAS